MPQSISPNVNVRRCGWDGQVGVTDRMRRRLLSGSKRHPTVVSTRDAKDAVKESGWVERPCIFDRPSPSEFPRPREIGLRRGRAGPRVVRRSRDVVSFSGR